MKTRIYLFAFMLLCSIFTGAGSLSAKDMSRAQAEARVAQIQERVNEVRTMELSSMSKTEKVALKKELKGMNKELKQMHPYLYISAGALILIIILILLLL